MIEIHRIHNEKKANWGKEIDPKAYDIYIALFKDLVEKGKAKLFLAEKDNVAHAACMFLNSGKRWIYIFNGASEMGRKYHGRLFVIDHFFRCNANIIFDFEDPIDAPDVSQYYASFGCESETFYGFTWADSRLVRSLVYLKRMLNGY